MAQGPDCFAGWLEGIVKLHVILAHVVQGYYGHDALPELLSENNNLISTYPLQNIIYFFVWMHARYIIEYVLIAFVDVLLVCIWFKTCSITELAQGQ